MNKSKQARIFVVGKVQGVCFRNWTVKQATELQLNGWVRNLKDGRVEVFVSGLPSEIDLLLARLWFGPTGADVTNVSVSRAVGRNKKGFYVATTI